MKAKIFGFVLNQAMALAIIFHDLKPKLFLRSIKLTIMISEVAQ